MKLGIIKCGCDWGQLNRARGLLKVPDEHRARLEASVHCSKLFFKLISISLFIL